MNTKKKVNRILTRNQIISSIVWASVILACSLSSGGLNEQMTYILIAGFFVEFLRISSSNKALKQDYQEEGN
ncbi:MAG: hypothetical protein ACI8YQ_003123 [Polaribacter sp.]|jgi:hypothetical protein